MPSVLLDLVHDAYLGDARVREFLMLEIPPPPAPLPNGSIWRGGSACGIRDETTSMQSLASVRAEAAE